ncbi:hypothetical protein BS017_RS23180 [Vibrio parahaemolyticus]|nr:hypothetical protein [Vibrio parahaemolyticus]EJG2040288.1 hypothetical protein [Vibrio parahaemolyticus]EJG2044942.1 hypothetical protein [Vibrio parahaemolyticus]EJG2235770.1 hypothetical protein [Vibrio parahaemolyticus]ELA7892760.1 hypothetical protein [Vibrio parahaemolyticus]
MNNQSVKIHYDGSGKRIRSHQMKASYVSASIEGFDTIYREAYKEANRIYKSKINTEILLEGGFQEGSLWWWLKLFTSESESQQSIETVSVSRTVLNSIQYAINLLRQMDLTTTEIVIKDTADGFEVDIDGERVVLDELQCAILTNPKIRSAISDIATPLTEDGIDTLTIDHGISSCPKIQITKEDKNNLVLRRSHKHIVEEGEIFGFYYVETLSYNPRSKWKLISKDNPSNSVTVSITDPKFLKRVSDNQEKFSKDDLLEVEGVWYKEKTKLTGKATVNYTITNVKDHIPAEEKQWKLL